METPPDCPAQSTRDPRAETAGSSPPGPAADERPYRAAATGKEAGPTRAAFVLRLPRDDLARPVYRNDLVAHISVRFLHRAYLTHRRTHRRPPLPDKTERKAGCWPRRPTFWPAPTTVPALARGRPADPILRVVLSAAVPGRGPPRRGTVPPAGLAAVAAPSERTLPASSPSATRPRLMVRCSVSRDYVHSSPSTVMRRRRGR
jgi:hypothetical protein